jgi:hypothetical protein
MNGGTAHMFLTGVLVSVAAPLAVLAGARSRPGLDRYVPPARVALPTFVIVHAAVTVVDRQCPAGATGSAVCMLALTAAAVVFWFPVFGTHRRLRPAARFLYLYAALPLLDLPAAWLITIGDGTGGTAMMLGMIPIGLIAVTDTWRWIAEEDRQLTCRQVAV